MANLQLEFEITDNSPEVLQALQNAIERGLMAVGETAVDYAQENCPVATGNLQGSISCSLDGYTESIGTNVEYGKYVEFGTGIYAESGGRRTAWYYEGDDGNIYRTVGQQPRPFLRPAVEDHLNEYQDLIIESVKNA